jgi:cytoskeleton protein RodZ
MQLFNAGRLMNEINGLAGMSEVVVPALTKQQQMPGAQLAAHRQVQGRSIDEVADLLKLTPRQILAIEADNYAVLPGLAVVRGFIRAYAKILKMDADPLIAMIAVDTMASVMPVGRELSTPFLELRLPSFNRRGMRSKLIVGIVGLVGFVALLLIMVQQGTSWMPHAFEGVLSSLNRTSVSAPVVVLSAPDSGVASISAKADEVYAAHLTEPLVTSAPPVTDAKADAKAETKTDTKQLQLAPTEMLASLGSLNKASANPDNALVLKLREDSWIEIRKPNGKIVISHLSKAGSSETFNINEPMSLIVGNLNGVEVTLRGEPLEMKHAAGSKIARLDLK